MGSMFESPPAQPFKVLVVGGSYGGLSAALNLQDLCRGLTPRCGPKPNEDEHVETPQYAIDVTIVDERDGFYHLIGSPLALASEPYAEKCWVRYDDIPALRSPNIRVLQGTVQSVDQQRKVATYVAHGAGAQTSELRYDYLVAASGLRRVWPVVPQSLRRKQYLFEAGDHIRAATAARHGVVIVGGGAVGIEMAAELKLVQPHIKVTLVHSRDKLLSSEPLPDDVKDRSLELLREADVDVLMSHRLARTEEIKDDNGNPCIRVHFTNGHTMLADQVAMAVSKSVPSTTFLSGKALDEEGYVKIQPSLAFPSDTPNSEDHFAIGDLVKWSGIKRCGAAMHMGYFAANNIHQQMQKKVAGRKPTFLELDEIPPMIGLAVGKKAVSYWPQAGMASGEDVMKAFFGDDLGFSICWNHLGLGGEKVL
ncbi:Apoptosis-inducing factor 2 [Madurella mycetomatis]|uniref:Apoptosis-inducing factor 2 n=1 Tax=Madurella mycetomatis TaxID=100816 RepID=A0A175W9P9_9PEZI|nr:Apoptosis-inducing factor 2 [Madurella mycetomatis]